MKRLIVNADDFGRHELINKAVEQAVEKGILRSAT
ncbi:MAG: ChbG/HpnK family deacetylase, partial [Anaerovibrio sp.]